MESEAQGNENQIADDENMESKGSPYGSGSEVPSETMIERLIARLAAVVAMLERVVPQTGIAAAASASEAVGPIVAMVEAGSREAELAKKLADAEKTIAELRASSSPREGRRTMPVSLLAKQDGSAPEPGAIDAALVSLSLEQRIAVKAQLLRSGLI